MQRPEQAKQPDAQEQGAPPPERGVEDLLGEVGELLEAREPTPEESFEQWQELKADEESARLQLIQAQARIDSPDLDVGLRNLGLALARAGIEARLQAVQTVEGAASDPMASEAVRSTAAQLQKIEDASRTLAAQRVPADQAPKQQRLMKELEERAQRIRSDMAPTLQQLHERVQKELAPETTALDVEIAGTPELMAARRAAKEAEVAALKERVHDREASRIALTADGKVLEQLAAQAGKEARAAAEAQLATPEGRAAFLRSELPRILKESGILLSPRDAEAEYQRRKTTSGGYYPRDRFARDLLTDLQRTTGGEGRGYDEQQKYEQQFGGSHARTWETALRAVADGLPGEGTRDRSKLYERLSGYTEALALGRGDIEEAQVGKVLQSLQEALGKSMEDPRAAERTLPDIGDAVARRERMRFQTEAHGLAMAQLETKSLGELATTAEGVNAELASLRSEAEAVTEIRRQLAEAQRAVNAFDTKRDRQRQDTQTVHEAGARALETRQTELRKDLQRAVERQRQQQESVEREQPSVTEKRQRLEERRRQTEDWLQGRDASGTSVRDVLEGKAQATVQETITALDQEIADREAKKPKLIGRGKAEAEIQALAGRRREHAERLAKLNRDQETMRATKDRADLEERVAAQTAQEAEARLSGLQEPLQSAEGNIVALRLRIEAADGELAGARQTMGAELGALDQQTEALRREVRAQFESGGSLRQRGDEIQRRIAQLDQRLGDLFTRAQKAQQEQPTSVSLRGEADRLRNESLVLQTARERFVQARQGLDAFLDAAKSVAGGRTQFYGRDAEKFLGIS